MAAAKALEHLPPSFAASITPPAILELGSGTGLCGLSAAAALGLPVTLTDLPEVLPSLRANVAANSSLAPQVTVAPCDWTALDTSALGGPHGLVLLADCVWIEPLVLPLVSTLEAVVRMGGPTCRVMMAHQSRSRRVDELLFGALEPNFTIKEVERQAGEPDRGKIDVYWLLPKVDLGGTV